MVVFISNTMKNRVREARQLNCFANNNYNSNNWTVLSQRITNGIPTLTKNQKRASLPVCIVALLQHRIKIIYRGGSSSSSILLMIVEIYRWAAPQALVTPRKPLRIALCFKILIIIFSSLSLYSSHISVWSDWARQTHLHRVKSHSNTLTLVDKTRGVSKR